MLSEPLSASAEGLLSLFTLFHRLQTFLVTL
jgi:hypothetical protein